MSDENTMKHARIIDIWGAPSVEAAFKEAIEEVRRLPREDPGSSWDTPRFVDLTLKRVRMKMVDTVCHVDTPCVVYEFEVEE